MYDILIIGSGISGACISRELAKYDLKTIILEKEFDVAQHATLANSAIVHSGHDPLPNTLKAKFNILGNRMYKKMSEELDIPFMECGGMVVATTKEEEEMIDTLYDRAIVNGLKETEVKIIYRDEIVDLEPNISDIVTKALYLPTTAVTYPLEAAIANIENAMDNGVELKTSTEVIDIKKENGIFQVYTNNGVFQSRVVINASGIFADEIAKMVSHPSFSIRARKGEYYVLHKDVKLVNSVIYPTPSEKGKGVIATPQYHGNTLLGPTSEFVSKEEYASTTEKGLNYVKEHIQTTVKNIPFSKIIRSFAGSRPTADTHDFIIEESDVIGFINVAGIESPGLTAAPAFAKYVVEELISKRLELKRKEFNPYRKKVNRVLEMTQDQKQQLFEENPLYGNIICRCENITEGEIVDAVKRNCGARSVTGVKNRVRAGAGRCQGGFCQPEVLKIIARELKMNPMDVNYSKDNSPILVAKTKGEEL
jgi:glycerol-3-phosphate dehydrogenase